MLVKASPPSGTGELRKRPPEVNAETDQMHASESSLWGRWRTEQRARLKQGDQVHRQGR
jgi:hypothetical protein